MVPVLLELLQAVPCSCCLVAVWEWLVSVLVVVVAGLSSLVVGMVAMAQCRRSSPSCCKREPMRRSDVVERLQC